MNRLSPADIAVLQAWAYLRRHGHDVPPHVLARAIAQAVDSLVCTAAFAAADAHALTIAFDMSAWRMAVIDGDIEPLVKLLAAEGAGTC